MLTADYDKLGLEPGDLLLDIGAGFGRHAFEAFRRGATPIACDLGLDELRSCNNTFAAMAEANEAPAEATAGSVQGSALALPFADGAFDRIIASEVLEHIVDDRSALTEFFRVLRPGGTMAVTVPAWFSETICWKLNENYHWPAASGGHVRIYSMSVLKARLRQAGFTVTGDHHAHGLHGPYWWLKCAVGLDNDDNSAVSAYHRLLTWDIVKRPLVTRMLDTALKPIGKSIVIYARRPGPIGSDSPAFTNAGQGRQGNVADVDS